MIKKKCVILAVSRMRNWIASGGDRRDTFHSASFCIFLISDIFFKFLITLKNKSISKFTTHDPKEKTQK